MRNKQRNTAIVDWPLVLLYFLFVGMGWLNIYAAVYNEEASSIIDASQKYGKQLTWIITAVVIVFILFLVDGKFFNRFAYAIYGFFIFLLVSVLLFGKEVGGARSWFEIGGFSIQPAEFAKIGVALALAKLLSSINVSLDQFKTRITGLTIVGIPAVLILLQNDTGSALVFLAFLLVLYREGMSGILLWLGTGAGVLFTLTLIFGPVYLFIALGIILGIGLYFLRGKKREIRNWVLIVFMGAGFVQSVDYVYQNVLEPHQQSRIDVLLGKKDDPHGAGYNTNQSKIAIGSGGLTGKGYLEGTQTKFDFVPEQSTDFIFCTVGEEWGFLGSFILVALFLTLFWRLIIAAERQRSAFSRIYGYSVACILFFHFAVNISMTIGLAPVIGIPLPFFSYGGSSLWGFTILLFIFIRLDAYRMETFR